MPEFLEAKLKQRYGADSAVPFKIMNKLGYMHGNQRNRAWTGSASEARARAHFAPNPSAIRAAVARRFPAIDVRNAVRGKMQAAMGK